MNRPRPDVAWDLRSPDVGLVIDRIWGMLRPFRLRTVPQRDYDARLFGRQFSHTGLLIIDYGQEVEVEADPMRSFSLIQIPVRGSFELRSGHRSRVVGANEAHVLGPTNRLHMHWSPDCRLLVLKMDEASTRRLLARCQSASPDLCRESEPGTVVRLDAGPGLSLYRMVCLLRDEALSDGALCRGPTYLASLESLLMRLLTQSLESDRRAPMVPAPSRRNPDLQPGAHPVADAAKAFMLGNLGRRLDAGEIALACGVSRRTLFNAFRAAEHDTPKAWLTQRRLDKVRESLIRADSGRASVTEIALEYGFNHLGRFSGLYRRRFGEYPSETLLRCRAH